jgi:hypothetical protein
MNNITVLMFMSQILATLGDLIEEVGMVVYEEKYE